MTPLRKGEVVVGDSGGEIRSYVTSWRRIKLRYQASTPDLPRIVEFQFRKAGGDEWLPGPTWSPAQPQPSWSPPWEGPWELRAWTLPISDSAPGTGRPDCVITFDWTPPSLEIEAPLPAETLHGGDQVSLRWTSEDNVAGSERVFLEVRASLDGSWRRLRELPNTGEFDWKLPNRPLGGARVRLVVEDVAGNITTVRIPGTLTVEGMTPEVTAPAEVAFNRARIALPYEVTLPGGGELERVELWITDDGGQTWRLLAYDEDLSSPFEHDVEEGHWGFRLVIQDSFGNRSAYPSPGDAPQGEMLVDGSPPEVAWGELAVARTDELDPMGTPAVEIRYAYRVRDFSLDEASLVASYRTADGTWQNVEDSVPADGEIRFVVPHDVAQPVWVRLTGRDLAENGFAAETSLYPREILEPPIVELKESPRGWYRAGEEVRVVYRVSWESAGPTPTDLLVSTNGETWTTLAEGLADQGDYTWKLPEFTAREVTLRIVARARDGRTLERRSTPFGVDADAPTARIVGPQSGYGDNMELLVEGGDTGSGVARYELLAASESGGAWEHAGSGEVGDGKVAMLPRAPGRYRLWIVAVDHAGNRGAGPAGPNDPGFAFVVADGPPGVRLLSFQDGEAYAGGSQHFIFIGWSGVSPLGGTLTIDYTVDEGASWRPITTVPVSTDRHLWRLPEESFATCRVRVQADEITGHQSAAQSETSFRIDATAPQLHIVSVTTGQDGSAVIEFEAEDPGGAGTEHVWLYSTRDGGKNWEAWPDAFPAHSPAVVAHSPGEYGFFVVGEDAVGNRGAAPESGATPHRRARIQPEGGPQLTLIHPHEGVFAGGSRHYVFWRLETSDAPFADLPVSLEYSLDGGNEWIPIARQLPLVGQENWFVPEREGAQVKVRALAEDLNGGVYLAESHGVILIDSTIPTVLFAGPQTSNQRPTIVDYRLGDPDSLWSVELWIRAVSTPDWRLAGEARAGEPLTADVPDGMYRVRLIGVDTAGNKGRAPLPGDYGDGDLLVDTITPRLEVDGVGDRDRLFHESEWIVLRPVVQDRHLSPFPVSFRLSDDGGATFRNLKRYHPNGDDFPWKLPAKPGLYYFEVNAEDLALNSTRHVIPIQVIPTPPSITLLTNPGGAVLAGGDELTLEWECAGVEPLHRGVKIEFTTDLDEWTVVQSRLPADGRLVWMLPDVDSNRCRFRFEITRPDGLAGKAWSGTFTVSTTRPDVELESVEPAPAGPPKDG